MTASIPWPSQSTTCINEYLVSLQWSQIHPSESKDPFPRTPTLVTTAQARNNFLRMFPAGVNQLVGFAWPSNLSLLLSILHSSFKMKNLPACAASRGYWTSTVMWKFSKIFNEKKRTKGILLRMKALWSIPLFSLYFHLKLSISLWPFVILSHLYTPLCDVTSKSDRCRSCAFLYRQIYVSFDLRREWSILMSFCKLCVYLKSV